MSKNCEGLRISCRNCERRFENYERMVKCPDCGESRECENYAANGSDFCANHGAPISSRRFYGKTKPQKTGAESKYRIVRLSSTYLKIKGDPFLSSLDPLEAILAGRLMELLERVDMGDVPDRMKALRAAWKNFKDSHPNIDTKYPQEHSIKTHTRIEEIFEQIYHDYPAWEQILSIIDEKRKLSETRLKHLKEMRALISAKDAYELVAKLLAGITKVIDDPKILRAIQYEFAKITGEHDIGEPGEGGAEIIEIDARTVDRGEFLHPRDAPGSEVQREDISPAVPEGRDSGGIPD